MPKRKAKQVRVVVPVEELALSKDENNTKGSKEDRIRALDLFASDFAIQGRFIPYRTFWGSLVIIFNTTIFSQESS